MKRVLQAGLLAAALLIGINVSAQDSPIEIGIKGGANLSDYTGDAGDVTKAKFGFNVGVTFDYNFTPNLAVITGVEFTTKGATIKEIDRSSNASFIQVPIHIGYKLPVSETVKVVFQAGPYIAIGVAGKTKSIEWFESYYGGYNYRDVKYDTFGDDGILDRVDVGLGLGVGFEFGKICSGIGWDFGLVDLSKGTGSAKMQNGYISVGYKF